MRNFFLILLVAIFVFSCVPLKKEEGCRLEFERIKTVSKQHKDYFIRGNLFVHGAYLVFYGDIGRRTFITLRSPFGRKLFSVYYSGEKICVRLPGEPEKCGKDLDIYWDYIGVKVPFSIRNLLTGKINISDHADYTCKNGDVYIEQDGLVLVYRGLKIKKLKYRDFTVSYFYEDKELKKVVVKKEGKEIFRIYIRELRET
ncbi:hypothetical protein SAMN06265182_0904 [Persephonella hydrogeniphila]|uniref:Lipoprotein n=1 Tax=Persephonella hydrogeniphila TaxID=198703 RepID=A0A285NCQ4_9AQUI|nr:hypothetical protein [Persephonella hydrogeniphila]SNZ07068.1 hypothetical protein SAMN06265182_0904 [Persephonella hydrogeniphila]